MKSHVLRLHVLVLLLWTFRAIESKPLLHHRPVSLLEELNGFLGVLDLDYGQIVRLEDLWIQ